MPLPTLFTKFFAAQTLGLILSAAFAVFGQIPKIDEPSELKAQQIKQLTDAQKRAQAKAIFREGDVLYQQRTKESLKAALLKFTEVRRLCSEVGDKQNEVLTLNRLGNIYELLGGNQKALEYYNQALPISKAVSDKEGEAVTLNNIGKVYSKLGENRKALEYFSQTLLVLKVINNKMGEAATLHNIGSIYSGLGEKEKALEYFNRVLLLHKVANDPRGEATTLNNIGLVYSDLGNKEKALEYYNQALPLHKSVNDRSGEATTLNNIGFVYSESGENRKALEYYNQALLLRKVAGDPGGEASTLNKIGSVYFNLGNKEKALEYFKQALLLRKDVNDKNGEAVTLNNIGRIYDILGEKQKAFDYYNQALSLFKAVGDRRSEAVTFSNFMYAWESLKDRRLAILYGKQSVNILQSLRADIKGLDKNLQQGFLGSVEETYRKLVELLIKEGRIPEAEQILAMLKEEEYFQFVRRNGDLASALDKRVNLSPSEKIALESYDKIAKELTRLGSEYAKLDKEKNQPHITPEKAKAIVAQQKAIDEKLMLARTTLDKFLEALKKEFSQEDKRVAAIEEGLQAEVKGWNDSHAVVISTIVGKENLSIIVTTSEIQTAHIVPISEEKLNTLVGDFRAALTDPTVDPRPAGQKLYDVLIKPLQKDLDGVSARTLVWSLDGNLRYAPMSALWDADKGYLIRRYANVVITLASRGNLALRPEDKKKWQALGVGVSKAVGGFNALGNVPGELSAIVRDPSIISKTRETGVMTGRRLLDEQFTYDAFRSNLGRFPIVHAATHFNFISGVKNESLESFLLLGNGEKLTLAKIQSSGTIFNGVQLLALSACDTAFGGKDADGREVEGFGAMAQKKGAKAVLATLWRVADESTRNLMIDFYGDYQKPHFNKAEALRQAQLALLQEPDKAAIGKTTKLVNTSAKQFAHPYYWSPFILIGNWW